MRHRTKFNLLVALGVILLLAMTGSVAYFATTKIANNIISTGKVDIKLYELTGPEDIKPFSDLINVKAGETYSKIPYVENIALEPVWVRAKITLLKTDSTGVETPVTNFSPLMTLENSGANWLKNEDGFYYYNLPLSSGEKTEPIFESVKFADIINEEYSLATYTLSVSAEAIQVVHNDSSPLNSPFATSTVQFEDGADNFVFYSDSDWSKTDLFNSLKGLMPGDTRTENILVKNASKEYDYIKIYLRAEPNNTPTENLLEKLTLNVYKDGELISSTLASNPGALLENTLLGTFNYGDEVLLTTELSVPLDLENTYLETSSNINWIFTAEAYKDGKIVTPNTGSAPILITVAIPSVVIASLLVTTFLILIKKHSKI